MSKGYILQAYRVTYSFDNTFAHSIHNYSKESTNPFVSINCAAKNYSLTFVFSKIHNKTAAAYKLFICCSYLYLI
ncbi:hypothetical protein GOM49_16700 [Clostridium bovifaecis]|uniref:Sigma-54 factor interaction domain-containing protein n=1 Tax=Clostridium bovifaecis TaxID=2184719 RepID=A0A6I6ET24_9CLOT|nr:hypothetical protein GOM49_16700 [Clostridium bovifaecis]